MHRITLLKNKIKEVVLASKLINSALQDKQKPEIPQEPEK